MGFLSYAKDKATRTCLREFIAPSASIYASQELDTISAFILDAGLCGLEI